VSDEVIADLRGRAGIVAVKRLAPVLRAVAKGMSVPFTLAPNVALRCRRSTPLWQLAWNTRRPAAI